MILSTAGLNQYVIGLAKALYTRGFELPSGPAAEFDDSGHIAFGLVGTIAAAEGLGLDAEISLDERWRPLPERRWERDEYAYDLIDHGRARRRAFHLHDRALSEARLGVLAHEHCDVLGAPRCSHYVGRDIGDGYLAIDLLLAAWVEPDDLGCDSLICLS
ncbi:MAG TPA: hypothetical protein VFP56_06030 [Candidatus Limnocylindrales bacterium]|nr:hypothetical protein [Candidatus Limnocylindrales bacterium]